MKVSAAVMLWAICCGAVFLLSTCLTGCTPAHRQGATIKFNPSNSMCLDATVANMHAAGCYAVSVEKTIYGITEVHCHEAREGAEDSKWINNNFIGIAYGTQIPENVQPICTDPFMLMTVKNEDESENENE